jgi:hypothetical protein
MFARDRPGAKSIDDCKKCPRGTFGDRYGLATRECSGKCSSLDTPKTKYYGDELGLTSRGQCKVCPKDDLTLGCNNRDQVMENIAGDLWREYQARRMKREQQ